MKKRACIFAVLLIVLVLCSCGTSKSKAEPLPEDMTVTKKCACNDRVFVIACNPAGEAKLYLAQGEDLYLEEATLAANSTYIFYKKNLVVVEPVIGEGTERIYIYALDGENIQKDRKMYEPSMPNASVEGVREIGDGYMILRCGLQGDIKVYFDGRDYELTGQGLG